MPRKSSKSIQVDGNIRCLRIYPTEGTNKTVSELQTIGIKLNREQAIHLARVLLAASQEWEEMDITGFRLRERQSDGTYSLTLTSQQDE